MNQATIVQPQLVSEFFCDGSKCDSRCCKNWAIDIDEETYKKYLALKLPNIEWNEELQSRIFKMQPNGFCPNLDSDGLCKIQKSRGESFLSKTCRDYPRHSKFMGGRFFERILSLSCPVAADLILKQKQPIEFGFTLALPPNFYLDVCLGLREIEIENVLSLQLAATRILQNRRMTIDQRLLTLGFFLDRVGDIRWGGGDSAEELLKNIETLEDFCMSPEFITRDLPKISREIKFDSEEFARIMQTILDLIRQPDSDLTQDLLDKLENLATLDSKKISTLDRFETIFENYLVNEWWIQLYPYRFDELSALQNFFVFLILHKLQQNILAQLDSKLDSKSEEEIVRFISLFSQISMHHTTLMKDLSLVAKNYTDLGSMMSSMLQV